MATLRPRPALMRAARELHGGDAATVLLRRDPPRSPPSRRSRGESRAANLLFLCFNSVTTSGL
jgi:hypothetical protein